MPNSNTANHDSKPTRTFQAMTEAGFQRDQNTDVSYQRSNGQADGEREIVSTRLLILREELQYEDIA